MSRTFRREKHERVYQQNWSQPSIDDLAGVVHRFQMANRPEDLYWFLDMKLYKKAKPDEMVTLYAHDKYGFFPACCELKENIEKGFEDGTYELKSARTTNKWLEMYGERAWDGKF